MITSNITKLENGHYIVDVTNTIKGETYNESFTIIKHRSMWITLDSLANVYKAKTKKMLIGEVIKSTYRHFV